MWSTIFQVIIALPKIFTLVKDIVKFFALKKEKDKQKGLEDGIDQTRKAQTKEEMQKANEETTRNLP